VFEVMKSGEKPWVACAIDSEGTILEVNCGIGGPGCLGCPHPRVEVSNTDKAYIDRLAELVPHGTVRSKLQPGGTKPLYVWRLMQQKYVLDLLKEVEPWLITKRRKAKEVLKRCL
jgi:hypothetical protein